MKESLRKRGMNYEALVRGKLDTALAFGQKLTLGAAEAEVIADASEQMLQDTTFIRSAPQGLKNKIKSVIKDFAKKVRAVFATLSGGHKESAALRELKNNMYHYVDDLQSKWDIAAVEMVNRQTEQGTQETEQGTQEAQQAVQYSAREEDQLTEDKYYSSTIDKWDGTASGGRMKVGRIKEGSIYTAIGLPAGELYFDYSKAAAALSKHGDHLTKDSLKQIPQMLANPVVITEPINQQVKNTVNVFGEMMGENGKPIMVSIMMRPNRSNTALLDIIRTVEMRGDTTKLITEKSLLYLSENKKRTTNWFQGLGNSSVPFAGTKSGFIRSISYTAETVNGERQFSRRDTEYMNAVEAGDMDAAQRMVDEAAREAGYTIRAYHGTGRADRVGTVFRADRATSGPMAFFTSDPQIAANYARDKADTSLAYDEEYSDYYTQFRVNKNGKSIAVKDLWRSLPFAEKQQIKEAGKHITWDENMENIIWDDEATTGLGNWDDYTLREHKGNALEALVDSWLGSGELYGHEGDFLQVLQLAGIKGAEYRDPDARHEKVYDTYLKIQNPFNTATVDEAFIEGYEAWYQQQPEGKYDRQSEGADMWDKNSITAERFVEQIQDDLTNGTTNAWTSIPDSVTDYLKSLGHDGIQDTGGKQGGDSHTVWIPFTSGQIKDASPVTYDDAGKVIPLSERFNPSEKDIRFALREVDGQQVVWVEENVLANKPEGMSAKKFIRNYLIDHIDDVYTIIESGSKVHPAKQLPQEYLYSREAQSHNKSNRNLFSAKLKIVPGIGEMVEIASNRRWEKTKHMHNKNAKYGVYRYDTRVAFDNDGTPEAYTAELVILNADDGKKYLYDIVNIKKDDITAKRLMVKARSGGETAQQTNAVKDSVLQSAETVNSENQFARRDEPSTADVRRIVGGMQITDRMNDTEKDMLTRYQSHLTEMEKLIEQIEEQKRIIDSDEATEDEKRVAKAIPHTGRR